MAEPLIKIRSLKKQFLVKGSLNKAKRVYLTALDGIDLDIYPGEALGLVGESGCGKSTLGKCILGLHTVTEGTVEYDGKMLQNLKFSQMRPYRQKLQMIFQDPYSSLNPRMTILQSVMAPLNVFKLGTREEKEKRAKELLSYVGLEESQIHKYPHEMSGGQRQRAVIARAMILSPDFVVCDEPVSALDASVRAQVLNLMKKMQAELNPAFLFISHDLSVVRYICQRVAVMYLGQIVELGSREDIFDNAVHPYTKALLSAIPVPDVDTGRKRIILGGDVPSPLAPPSGCRFRTRCPKATELCQSSCPKLKEIAPGHIVACHYADSV